MSKAKVNQDQVIAADTAMSSLMLLAALQLKIDRGVHEALAVWEKVEQGLISLSFTVEVHRSQTTINCLMQESGMPLAPVEVVRMALLSGDAYPGAGTHGAH